MPPHLTSRPERVCSAIRPADQELRVLRLSIAADAIPPIGQEGPQARGYVFMVKLSTAFSVGDAVHAPRQSPALPQEGDKELVIPGRRMGPAQGWPPMTLLARRARDSHVGGLT